MAGTLDATADEESGVVGKLDVYGRLVAEARKFALKDVGGLGLVNVKVWREGIALASMVVGRLGGMF